MYYPIQVPYILNKEFSEAVRYSEEIVPSFQDFFICLWEMQPISKIERTLENIFLVAGSIDLVADFHGKKIGFAGMSKTNFHFKINLPSYAIGARFKPGAFHALTNIPAFEAMDTFLPLNAFDKDFNAEQFFALSYSEAKEFFKNYIGTLMQKNKPNEFIALFDELNENIPDIANDIYKKLYYSPRQIQRLFAKNYGLSPQIALCILRFQKCLKILSSKKSTSKEIAHISSYYDQSHFIKDFKRYIGLTPFEFMRKYT